MTILRCSDDRADHIAQHNLTVSEVEEVWTEHARYETGGRDNSTLVYGRTAAGRYVLVVTGEDETGSFVITARDMTDGERRIYQRRVGKA